MATRDDLNESLIHLEYEIAMMVATPRMLSRHPLRPRFNKARPPGYYWNNDLLTVAEDADVAVVIGADGSDVMKTLPA